MAEGAYGYETRLDGVSFEDAMERLVTALREEGFGVLTEIDVKATLKKKLNVDFRRYVILGACNPDLARRALEIDAQIGLLLPCNAVVQELPGPSVSVSIVNPRAQFQVTANPALEPVVQEVQQRIGRVLEAL